MIRRRARAAAPAALLGAAAVGLAAVLALAPIAGQGPVRPLGALAGFAVALLVAGLALPMPGVLPWALGLLAIEYLVALELRRAPVDPASPAYAGAFFLCAELAWLGLEARRGRRPWARRGVAIAALAVGGSALAALLLVLAVVPLAGGPPMTAVGVAATIAVAACLAWLGRR